MSKVPLRFSLATLLLLVTIVCLSAALWSSSKELRRARADLEAVRAKTDEYRNELGYPTIEDPSKLHFIRVPLPGPQQWQWRVYVPQGSVSTGEADPSNSISSPWPNPDASGEGLTVWIAEFKGSVEKSENVETE